MKRITIVLTALLAAKTALAGTRSGVTMPDRVTVSDKTLTLNGMGLREATVLKVDVYVAGLYVENASSNPATLIASNQTKMITLRFKRHVDRDDIRIAWDQGFKRNAAVPFTKLEPLITELNSWMPSFSKGDTLTFTLMPGKGVAVDINGKRKGILGDDDFARSLISIWLGPRPPTNALKRGMLGRHPST
ncbi:MAG TPA: chalcone isomerase family protein [Kofleriaceae bacterium]|nr:chalcone isomerase family protein [Kofleriaceae bacterium]